MATSENPNFSNVKCLEEQLTVARKEISNLRQQIKNLGHIHNKECDSLRQILNNWKCNNCQGGQNQAAAVESAAEAYADGLFLRPIGVISTNFPERRGTPRQSTICSETVAKLTLSNEVFTNPDHALEGLGDFSHIWILYHFHKNDSTHVRAKVAPPRLNGIRTGVFATRSPHRPSPIGLSLVKIEYIEGNCIYFSGVDMIDETPVLDIKPYIPQYDCPSVGSTNSIDLRSPEPSTSRRLDGRETQTERLTQNDGDGSVSLVDLAVRFDSLRPDSRIGEREAPDGEEGEISPNQYPVPSSAAASNDVRVPPWISEPPVVQLSVQFNERALAQLQTIREDNWEQTRTAITNVLREDPRSVYLRNRWGSQFYTFRIADVNVSCKFDDSLHVVSVFQIRRVESLENN